MRLLQCSIWSLLLAHMQVVSTALQNIPPIDHVPTSHSSAGPTGNYCGNASYLVLYAAIEVSFFNKTPALNISATVDLLPVVHCMAEPFSYNDTKSNDIILQGLSNSTDCLSKFVTLLGGDPSGVSLTYNPAQDSLNASFEGESCIFTRHECHEHPGE